MDGASAFQNTYLVTFWLPPLLSSGRPIDRLLVGSGIHDSNVLLFLGARVPVRVAQTAIQPRKRPRRAVVGGAYCLEPSGGLRLRWTCVCSYRGTVAKGAQHRGYLDTELSTPPSALFTRGRGLCAHKRATYTI